MKVHPVSEKSTTLGYLLLAYAATGLGIAGVFLPLLPATPFLLVAVWAAPKGSQRIHDWIYTQPAFARLINNWHEQRAVPLSAKWLATVMMLVSWLTLIAIDSHWIIVLSLSILFVCIGGFLWTRPNPEP
ncbi:MAG: DUF454 domain-containing protein [Gammaproteobacteria bacterium]|nr:DUF454 domain-containing protein [Gammaproteobacteria bacterium]